MLPQGWQVSEAPWVQEAVEGWLPIVPRGFVQLGDLTEVPEEDLKNSFLSPGISQGSPGQSPQVEKCSEPTVASARNALLALREEHVRLREANIKLRERELSKKHEIDNLEQAKQLTQSRLTEVQQELEHGDEELRTLRSKLQLCREAITTAVKSVDAIYHSMDQGASAQEVSHLAANANEAEEAISELLAATEDAYSRSTENCEEKIEKCVEKTGEKERKLDRAPLRDLNVS